MKKKVLFALIALFSFLSSWAADVVTVGGYDVTLSSKVVALPATGNATAPVVASVKTGTSGNLLKASESVYKIDEGQLVEATLNAVGNYFLKVTTTDAKTLFVPFQVGKTGEDYFDFEHIWTSTTFNASVNDGILKKYYTEIHTSGDDFDDTTGEPAWSAIAAQTNWRALMFPQINYKVKGLANNEKCKVYVQYKTVEGTTETWNGTLADNDSYENGNFWMLSIPELYKGVYPISNTEDDVDGLQIGKGYVLNYNNDGETVLPNGEPLAANSTIQDALEADFNWDYVQFFLVPTVTNFSVTLDYYETVYAGQKTRVPVVTGIPESTDATVSAKWYGPDGSFDNLLTEPNDQLQFGDSGNPFAKVGTYTLVVSYTDQSGTESAPTTYAVAQYVVKPLELTVGAGNLYIGYGDADPTEPSYGTVWSQLADGDNLEDIHISGLSVVRKTPKTGTDPEAVNTVIPYTIIEDNPTAGNPNYTLKVTPTDGNIIVTKKFLSEPEFTVTVEGDLVYNGTAQMPTVTVKRGDATLVQNTDYVVELASETEDNINANVEQDGKLIADKDHIQIIIKAKEDGNYTSIVKNGGDETLTPIEKEFDIAQRNINEATMSLDIPTEGLFFNNAEQKPAVTVTYNNKPLAGVANDAEDKDGKDYEFKYEKNIYVNDGAKAIIEAHYSYVNENAVDVKHYDGNFYGTNEQTFNIQKYAFTLQLTEASRSKSLGEDDPELECEADPALPGGLTLADVLVATPTVTRVGGEHVGIYTVTIEAALSEENKENVENSAPSNNFTMTIDQNATFEIYQESEYFVSSKGVTREFKSGDTSVPFAEDGKGFNLYRQERDGSGNLIDSYTLIPETSDVFKEIVDQNRVTGNELVNKNQTPQPAVNGGRARIIPVVVNDEEEEGLYDYTLSILDEKYFESDDVNEGYLVVTPRKVTIKADNLTSVFGEDIVTPLTSTVYEGQHQNANNEYDVEGLTKLTDFNLVSGNPNAANTIGHYVAPTCADAAGFVPNPTTEWPVKFAITITTPTGNPNYDIVVVNGTYTITKTTKKITIAATGTKGFGEDDADATWTAEAKLDGEEYDIEDYEIFTDASSYERKDDEGENAGDYDMSFIQTKGTGDNVEVVCPPMIDGYEVDYENSTAVLTIEQAGTLTLTATNQIIVYGTTPVEGADATGTYLKVNGANGDLADIDAKLEIEYPTSGLIKNGATINVTYDKDYVSTNYKKVIVKTGKLYVNAANEITLKRVAKADYADKAENYGDIVKGKKNTAEQTIKDYDGVENVIVHFSVPETPEPLNIMYAEKWYAMVLPFATSVKEISDKFGYAVVETLDKTSSDIHFKIQMQEIPANTPFIVKIYENKSLADISFGEPGKTIVYSADPSVTNAGNVKFTGSYSGKVGFSGKEYFFSMAKDSDPSKYYYGSDENTTFLLPLGAYIADLSTAEAGTRVIYIDEPDGTTTAIEAVDAEGATDAEVAYGEGWYTITGIKLDAEPTTSGTYIFNGKKVFIQK
jgi:hypothetical protein